MLGGKFHTCSKAEGKAVSCCSAQAVEPNVCQISRFLPQTVDIPTQSILVPECAVCSGPQTRKEYDAASAACIYQFRHRIIVLAIISEAVLLLPLPPRPTFPPSLDHRIRSEKYEEEQRVEEQRTDISKDKTAAFTSRGQSVCLFSCTSMGTPSFSAEIGDISNRRNPVSFTKRWRRSLERKGRKHSARPLPKIVLTLGRLST